VELPVRKPFRYKDEQIVFYPATHILGSVKILLKQADGTRILYTGDFRMPQRPPQTDVLVIEATYGDPKHIRRFGKEFPQSQLVRLVKQKIGIGPIQIHSTQGKLQEVMRLLRKQNVQAPFLMPKKVYAWSLVYKQYGKDLGECFPVESQEAEEIQRSKNGYILFFTIGSKMLNFNKYFCLKISGREPWIPFQKIAENYYSVTISDHADLSELLTFIERSGAKLVITDGSRCGASLKLADEVKRRLKKDAYSMPSQGPTSNRRTQSPQK